jgi:hypothetical protein
MRARQGSGWYGLAGPLPWRPPRPHGRRGAGSRCVRPLLAFQRARNCARNCARGSRLGR